MFQCILKKTRSSEFPAVKMDDQSANAVATIMKITESWVSVHCFWCYMMLPPFLLHSSKPSGSHRINEKNMLKKEKHLQSIYGNSYQLPIMIISNRFQFINHQILWSLQQLWISSAVSASRGSGPPLDPSFRCSTSGSSRPPPGVVHKAKWWKMVIWWDLNRYLMVFNRYIYIYRLDADWTWGYINIQ